MLPEGDRYYMTRSELLDRVSVLLAGRVAEQVVFNEISTGAQNDLERATLIVRQMIMEYGMSDELGPITLGHKHDQIFLGRDLARERDYSEEIARAIDKEIRRTIDRCYHKGEEILVQQREKLDELAAVLLEKETLDATEIEALIEGKDLAALERQKEQQAGTEETERPLEKERKKKLRTSRVKVVLRPEKGELHSKPSEEMP
jgi:cell division protease FtsH